MLTCMHRVVQKPVHGFTAWALRGFYEEMRADFSLYGQVGNDFPELELGVEYDGFLAQRKFS